MGGLIQQVNLYRGAGKQGATTAGARLLMFFGIATVCLVLMLVTAGEVYLSGISADRAKVAQERSRREAELAELTARLVRPEVDPFLEAELARLGETKDALHRNLAAIARHAGTHSQGFSAYFGGLARNTLEGLWFRNVALSAGGEEMLLRGQTTEPELVPRLLQTLAVERVFAGRTFRKVSFERRETQAGALIDFELRSAQREEVEDAG